MRSSVRLMIDSSIFTITITTHMATHNGGHCPQEEKGPELANVMIRFVTANPKDSRTVPPSVPGTAACP